MSLNKASKNKWFLVVSRWRKGLAILILLIVIFVIPFSNPRDILTKKSEKFSQERFDEIEIGDPISLAIQNLGEPLSVTKPSDDKSYNIYLFMGEYPDWVIGGTECWFLVDLNGNIFEKRRYVE